LEDIRKRGGHRETGIASSLCIMDFEQALSDVAGSRIYELTQQFGDLTMLDVLLTMSEFEEPARIDEERAATT
jgi:hypothetical protein